MKRLLLVLTLGMLMMAPVQLQAGDKTEQHVAYVLKNLNLDAATKAKLKPVLVKYYEDMAAAKKSHKALKDKLSDAEDAGKLTAAQCDQLFESKQNQETAELAVIKKYYAQFKTILPTPKAYKAIKLVDDKVDKGK